MRPYLRLLQQILDEGEDRDDRTGTGTISIFGTQIRMNLENGFPLLTTKKMFLKGIVHELLWFLSGSTDESVLSDAGVGIWKEWATEEQCAKFGRKAGDLGPVYGHQWRDFGATPWTRVRVEGTYDGEGDFDNVIRSESAVGFDQIAWVIGEIKRNPTSRRLVVTAWNPHDAAVVALPPRHTLFQFYVADGGRLWCHVYMRSADAFLGVPFNIASYALLTMMVAEVCSLTAAGLVVSFGDVHIYKNHLDQVQEQLRRKPKPLPKMLIRKRVPDIFSYKPDDFKLLAYDPYPAIKGEVSI